MKVSGKRIIVTGGGNGMGREIVLNLLSKGSKVIAVDISESALEETKLLTGDKVHTLSTFIVDVTNKEAVENFREKVLAVHGYIDGLINNAGILQPFRTINELSFDTIDRVFNVNFYGLLYMTKLFLPHLLTRPEAHIVNISSMGGFLPVAGQGIYGASKASVKILSESLDSELSDTNVGITTVFPGAIQTNIKRNSGLGKEAGINADEAPEGMAFSPVKASGLIVNSIEKKQKYLYIGKDSKSMNIIYRLRPNVATRLIYSKIKHKI